MMSEVQLTTISTIDAIRQQLEEDIYALYYSPGEKITENVLTKRYGVSRNTLREAIAFLQANGLLVKIPNKGVFVKEISDSDIKEIFNLRAVLECESIKELIDNHTIIDELKICATHVEFQNAQNNWYGSMNADIAFHETLVRLTNNQRLLNLYTAILSEVKLCIFQSKEFSTISSGNAMQHSLIINYIEQHNTEMAQKILSEHINSAINGYILGLDQKKNRKK